MSAIESWVLGHSELQEGDPYQKEALNMQNTSKSSLREVKRPCALTFFKGNKPVAH